MVRNELERDFENFAITWAGYGDDVIGHDRKLKKVQPLTNFLSITITKNQADISYQF